MDREEMVRIDDAITDAIGAGDAGAFDSLMGPALAADFREGIGRIRSAFPDYTGLVVSRVVEGDRMASQFVYHGTHQGEWLGVPATGRRARFSGPA